MNRDKHPRILRNPVRHIRLGALIPLTLLLTASPPARAFDSRDQANNGPVRMARFVVVEGDVDWRHDPQSQWTAARRNLPIRQGAQIAVPSGGRAEIQFDDGTRLRLGGNAMVTLQTLYSDADGEFTEITQTDGPAVYRLSNQYSVYQINTPSVAVKCSGPARFRVTSGDRTDVVDWQGKLSIDGPQGATTVLAGQCLNDLDTRTAYHVSSLPRPDNFDTWCSNRDRDLDKYYTSSQAHHRLPSNIGVCSDNLDDYGTWRQDSRYGDVWVPRASSADWQPYRDGRWVWVDTCGWTWVGDEPWGWAPYHYGSWIHESYGWGWCPGPRYQYWSPGVVAFNYRGDSLAWAPLAPAEVVYPPSLSIGFGGRDWSLFFSIGQAAVYYPTYYSPSRFAFVADPWPNQYINRTYYYGNRTVVNNITINNFYMNRRNDYLVNSRYVPVNVRSGGAVLADARTFGRVDRYRTISGQQAVSAWTAGRMLRAPKKGQPQFGGPAIRPNSLAAMAPTRSFKSNVRIPRTALARPVYRAPLPAHVAKASTLPIRALPPGRGGRTAAAAPTRGGGRPVAAAPRPTAPGVPNRLNTAAAQKARQARQALGMRTAQTNRPGAPNRPNARRQGPSATLPATASRIAAANKAAAARRVAANRAAAAQKVAANRAAASRKVAANRSAENRAAAARQRNARVAQANRQHAANVRQARARAAASHQQQVAANRRRAQHNAAVARSQAAERRSSEQAQAERRRQAEANRRQVAENRARQNSRRFYRQQAPSDNARQRAERQRSVEFRQGERRSVNRPSPQDQRGQPNNRKKRHPGEQNPPG